MGTKLGLATTEPEPQPLRFHYTNWRGEAAIRCVTPVGLYFGTTDWYPGEPQWLMLAHDHDRDGVREFALLRCIFITEDEPAEKAAPLRGAAGDEVQPPST